MLTASLVIYHNSPNDIDHLLKCVLNSPIDKLFIIDNSRNDSFRILEKRSDKIRYIHNANIGYGGAHNIAIREAIEMKAEYHVVVNPDIYFERGVIEKLTEYMDNNPEVGQLMPRIVYPNGELQYVCKMIPTPFNLLFKRFLPSKMTRKSMDRFQLKYTGYKTPMNVPYLSGCFMFFRIESLKKVGLFDERFFMYPEDIDITRRMHEQYRTMFYPEVTVVHAHAAESKANSKMLWIHITNMIRYFNKWGWCFDKKRKRYNQQLENELKNII